MRAGIFQYLIGLMKGRIVQHDVHGQPRRILTTQPLEKRQECPAVLLARESTPQSVAFQVIHAEHVSHSALAAVSGPKAIPMLDSRPVPAVTRLEIERSKLIDRQPHAAFGPHSVEPSNSPV